MSESNTMPLKYLFTAIYKDGSMYHQTKEDRSVTEPDKRSAFFDVKQDQIARFVLRGDGREIVVDLTDGHFEVDGMKFVVHNNPEMVDFKLLFFREHTHTIEQSRDTDTEVGHSIRYIVGWKTKVEGIEYQRTMIFE